MIEVRRALPEDYAEAGRVTGEAYREFVHPNDEGWEDHLRMVEDVAARADRTLVLVAVDGERILGSATLELEGTIGDEGDLEPGEARLRMLGVAPVARGRGAGSALVQACIERARAAGKKVLTLRTTRDMRSAQSLYISMGFVRDPERDRRVSENFTLLGFRLPL